MFHKPYGNGFFCKLTFCLLLLVLTITGAQAQAIYTDGFEGSDLPVIPVSEDPTSSRQIAVPVGTSDANQGFYQYLPPGYGGGDKYPLLIFVHGLGENGNGDSELSRLLRNGPPRLIDRDTWDASRPFVVLSPQHTGGGCTTSSEINAFINFALETYDLNPERVYLTGLSCGAIGSWNYAGSYINTQIAAMVPIAGNGTGAFARAGCDLGDLPIWAFHGDNDSTVNVSGTTNPVNSLLACSPAPRDVKMTIYPGVGHNSWSRTYDLSAGHDIYSWMLEYQR